MLSGSHSLSLTDGSGFSRPHLVVVLVAVVTGIGVGGWYLIGPKPMSPGGELAVSVPATTGGAVSTDTAVGPAPGAISGSDGPPDVPPSDALPEGDIAAANAPVGVLRTGDVSIDDGLLALNLAAPFGLRMGTTSEQLPGTAEPVADGHYRLTAVRQPLAAFTDYGVRIGPGSGLCGVWASGIVADIETDGVALRGAFDAVESAMTARLGPAARTDVLLVASAFTAPDAWMQALERRQRYLFSVWSGLTGARLPADVRRVTLRAGAESASAGSLRLEIAFRNEAACDATMGDATAGSP